MLSKLLCDKTVKSYAPAIATMHCMGNWKGYREIHLEGDWLLIYRVKHSELLLVLTRTGSHDDLF